MAYRTYRGDPKWIKAKYDGSCDKCTAIIRRGADAYYRPNGRKIYCATCGHGEASDFDSHAFDEAQYQSQY